MKKYLLTLALALSTFCVFAQSKIESSYKFELQLSNSENMDYRLEQEAFLFEKLNALEGESHFDKSRSVYVIHTKVNYNTTQLRNEIEAKGITVIGTISKTEVNPITSKH